jgi:hypothetical protein
MAEELKTLRTASKRKVNQLIGKLKTSLQYGDSKFLDLKSSLEDEYEKLQDLDMQIVELEGVDSAYLDSITPAYEAVIKMAYNSLKEEENIQKIKRATNLQKTVDRSLIKIENIMDRIKIGLAIEPTSLSQRDAIKLEVDVSTLTSEVDGLLKDVASLGQLSSDIKDLECKVDAIISATEQYTRDSNVLLKQSKLNISLRSEAPTFEPSLSTGSSMIMVSATQTRSTTSYPVSKTNG